jgi:hypothetical protein
VRLHRLQGQQRRLRQQVRAPAFPCGSNPRRNNRARPWVSAQSVNGQLPLARLARRAKALRDRKDNQGKVNARHFVPVKVRDNFNRAQVARRKDSGQQLEALPVQVVHLARADRLRAFLSVPVADPVARVVAGPVVQDRRR